MCSGAQARPWCSGVVQGFRKMKENGEGGRGRKREWRRGEKMPLRARAPQQPAPAVAGLDGAEATGALHTISCNVMSSPSSLDRYLRVARLLSVGSRSVEVLASSFPLHLEPSFPTGLTTISAMGLSFSKTRRASPATSAAALRSGSPVLPPKKLPGAGAASGAPAKHATVRESSLYSS